MNIFYKFYFICILIPLCSAAQSYQPGEVVTAKGDTLHGFINYREWEKNPREILFKTGSERAVKYTPNDITYFNVNAGHLARYIAYIGPVTLNTNDLSNLPIGRDSSVRMDTVFLKYIQTGKNLTLFRYADNLKVRYFIAEGNATQPEELIYQVYWNSIIANGRDRTVYENIYKNQIYEAALKADPGTIALKNNIQKIEYTEPDLIEIFSKINGTSKTDLATNNATKTKPLTIALIAAATVAILALLIGEFSAQSH